jgi:WD40 repeat protein
MAAAMETTQAMPPAGTGTEVPPALAAPLPPIEPEGEVKALPASPGLGFDPGSSWSGKSSSRYQREIARIGAQVADALDYAHKRKVIHRDIKPHNILLDALGNAWITDFGLAKLKQQEGDGSSSQAFAGTFRYMAPERFQGKSDGRDDIYALGATLYEFLALRPVFDASDPHQLLSKIEHDPPTPLRQIDRRIHPDLAAVIAKALAKDPADRYASAAELRDELRRFIEGRPVKTRPVPVYSRFWRWCKREPWLAGANIAAAVMTTVLAIGSTIAAKVYYDKSEEITEQARRLERSDFDTRERLFESLVSQARATRFSRRMGQRFESLKALRQAADIGRALKLPPTRFEPLRDEAIACLALPDLEPAGRVIARPPNAEWWAFDSTMSRYALRFRDGTISVRRFTDDQEIVRFQARGDRDIYTFGFSPDGRYLATTHYPGYALTVWDVDGRSVAFDDRAAVSSGGGATFSPDSRRIAVAHKDGEFVICDLATGLPRVRRRGPGIERPQFSPDGSRIALSERDGEKTRTCRILDANTGRLALAIPMPAVVENIAWSPDGTTLATPCDDRKIYLWDAATGIRRVTLEGHVNGGLYAAFHPAGTLLVSNGWEGRLWLWDQVLGRPWLSLTSDTMSEFSRDGRIALGRADRLTVYQVDPALEYRTLAPTHVFRQQIAYGRPSIRSDGRVLALGTTEGVVLWDLACVAEIAFLPIGHAWHSMFAPSGDLITSGSSGVQRWPVKLDPERGEFRIGPPQPLPLPAGIAKIDADRSGRIVALADFGFAFVATPERTSRVGPLDDCRFVAVSPDGQWLATGSFGKNGAQVWRVRDATQVAHLAIEGSVDVVFSPDGKWLMTQNPPCRLWEVGTWHKARQIGDLGCSFSPDSRLVAVQDASKMLRLVDTETGRTLARLESPDLCDVWSAAFSPDGSRLVIVTHTGPAVHIWDLRAIRRRLALMGLDWDPPSYPAPPPIDADLHIVRFDERVAEAVALCSQGMWEKGAAAFDDAFTAGVLVSPWLLFENAILRLAVGDAAGYEATRKLMLQMLRHNNTQKWMELTAHAYVLAPIRPADRQEALRLAASRAAFVHSSWSDLVTGMALYRSDQFAEAATVLKLSLVRDPEWDCRVLIWLVLAMADHRLGRHNEARSWSERAESWVEARLRGRPGGTDRGIPENWLWRDGVLLHLLRREAGSLIGEPLPALPDDVFDGRKP